MFVVTLFVDVVSTSVKRVLSNNLMDSDHKMMGYCQTSPGLQKEEKYTGFCPISLKVIKNDSSTD